MAGAKCFEDLIIWQEARQLCQDLYPYITRDAFNTFPRLRNQIEGSSGSVPDNIAEGFERGGNKELVQFLYFSKGSCGELRSQIYRAYDYHLITETEKENLIAKCKKLSSHISNFIKSIYSSDYKGEKNKFNSQYNPEH